MRTLTRFIVMVASLTLTSLLIYGCGGGGSGGSPNYTPYAPSVNKTSPATIPATGDNAASVSNSIESVAEWTFEFSGWLFGDFVGWTDDASATKSVSRTSMAKRIATVVTTRKAIPQVPANMPKVVNAALPELDKILCPYNGKANANESGTGDNYSFSLNFDACQEDPTDIDGSYERLSGPLSISGTVNETTGTFTFNATENLTWTEYNNSTDKKVLNRWSDNFSMSNGKFTVEPGMIDPDPEAWITMSYVASGQYKYENLNAEITSSYVTGVQRLDVALDRSVIPNTATFKTGSVGTYYYEKNVLRWYQTATFQDFIATGTKNYKEARTLDGWIAIATGGPDALESLTPLNGTYQMETVTPIVYQYNPALKLWAYVGQYRLNAGTPTETTIVFNPDGSVDITVAENTPIHYATEYDYSIVPHFEYFFD